MISLPPTRALLATLAAMSIAACGSAAEAPDPLADLDSVTFEVSATIEAGSETSLCKFVRMPSDRGEMASPAVEHVYSPGSHHFLLYRTDLTEIPEGGDALAPCDDQGWMSLVRGAAYAAQSPEARFLLPEGVGQRFSPGEILLLQVHYVNATAEAQDVDVRVDLYLTDTGETPTDAGVFFFFNPVIHVPAHGKSTSTLSCPVPDDAHLVIAGSHMHRHGTSFLAVRDGAEDRPLYETDTWSDPVPRVIPPGDESAFLPAGSTITYSCNYENMDGADVIVGSDAAHEMCMFVGMYYPRQARAVELCHDGLAVTEGSVSCFDTLGCLGACAGDDFACRGACIDHLCPNAAMPFLRFFQCTGPACGATCDAMGSDSEACQSCVAEECGDEVVDCQKASCAAM